MALGPWLRLMFLFKERPGFSLMTGHQSGTPTCPHAKALLQRRGWSGQRRWCPAIARIPSLEEGQQMHLPQVEEAMLTVKAATIHSVCVGFFLDIWEFF